MNAGDEPANPAAPHKTSSSLPVAIECWTDVFELSQHRGRRRRLFGPANFAALRSREPAWGTSIDSLIVGPGAYVRLYNSHQPTSPGRWLLPRQVIEDLLALNVAEDLDSIEILANGPQEGHPGWPAFVVAIGQSEVHG